MRARCGRPPTMKSTLLLVVSGGQRQTLKLKPVPYPLGEKAPAVRGSCAVFLVLGDLDRPVEGNLLRSQRLLAQNEVGCFLRNHHYGRVQIGVRN